MQESTASFGILHGSASVSTGHEGTKENGCMHRESLYRTISGRKDEAVLLLCLQEDVCGKTKPSVSRGKPLMLLIQRSSRVTTIPNLSCVLANDAHEAPVNASMA
jgi:hypothetical protein